jgi:hypothetical protein
MSYSLITKCRTCQKRNECADHDIIQGAINGIHMTPYGLCHKGSGSVTIDCSNYQPPAEADTEKE